MNDILRQIEDKILFHSLELEKLTHARDVVASLVDPQPPATEAKAPIFTVRRVKDAPKRSGPKQGDLAKILRGVFLNAFKKFPDGSMTTAQLMLEAFGDREPTMKERKSGWNVLSAMVKHGQLVRISVGIYTTTKATRKVYEEAALGTEQPRVPVPA